jgi:23S rRNA (cytidine2498-2'-O)-methyltransferase
MLLLGQHGFEALMAREAGGAQEQGPGWARVAATPADLDALAFPHAVMREEKEITGESVNTLAQSIVTAFLEGLRGERIEAAWPLLFWCTAETPGLGRRMGAVEDAVRELLRRKLSRVAKLAVAEPPRGAGEARGLFVFFADFGRAFVARAAWFGGQRRMADDERAPSRSYLKVEEAYVVLGREPVAGETVADLGAAPGGWSYSAAKRGARVIAVDNGPLKGGAFDYPLIGHRKEDAFRYEPGPLGCDWLFCDMVEEPHHVLRSLVEPWLARRWCRRFVINLKFGRVDPLDLLPRARAVLAAAGARARIRHLYHDREEFTLVGEIQS